MTAIERAVERFECETAVERLLFMELDQRLDGGANADPSTLRMAGVRIAGAAERLLQVLNEDVGNEGARVAGGGLRLSQ